jgi:predicted metal-dependent HD superfamily phosphohydrolase
MVDELMRLYEQPHRHYHNLVHLSECMREFQEVFMACDDAHACEMALWYHDVVYDPGEATNERLSANKARFDCMRLHTPESFADKVCLLVLSTTHSVESSGDAAIVADIDLAILASPWERYKEYEGQIRMEYGKYADKDYLAGRSLFLDGMMRKPRIYATDYFHHKYEAIARANMARSLLSLGNQHA